MTTGETTKWFESGQVPDEPVFIPAPSGKEEEGALLTVALDVATQSSKLIILDAATINPYANSNLKKVFPYGFHGTFGHKL